MRVRRHSAATVALMVMAATVVRSGAHAAAADGLLAVCPSPNGALASPRLSGIGILSSSR